MSFEYLDHPLAYKYVKDQAIVVLKSRHVYLKKKIKRGEGWPWNCEEHHWNQLKEVLVQEEDVERVVQMKGIRATQKNCFSSCSFKGAVGILLETYKPK